MRKPKPKPNNVVSIPVTGPDRDAARAAAVRGAVKRLRPAGLSNELVKEWNRVATILADPAIDRLKPRFVDAIEEYCRARVRLRKLRAALDEVEETYLVEGGRNGDQVKSHPFVGQMNVIQREWRALCGMLGLSPTNERNIAPGQGDTFDDSEREFA